MRAPVEGLSEDATTGVWKGDAVAWEMETYRRVLRCILALQDGVTEHMNSLLDRLAERVGIAAQFDDALGQRRETSTETKRALLKALGLPATDEEDAGRTLQEIVARDRDRALPDCVVLYPHEASVPITLPVGHGSVRWTVTLEEGGKYSGESWFHNLPTAETQKTADQDQGGVGDSGLEQRMLSLPEDLPWGYHRLRLENAGGRKGTETSLIVTPGQCWLPGENDEATSQATEPEVAARARVGFDHAAMQGSGAEGGAVKEVAADEEDTAAVQKIDAEEQARHPNQKRFWGVAVQMYLLRSERNWGIGDFTDLLRFVEIVKARGGAAVGVNPLHGMFPDLPEQSSPYSPLSRYLLNALNIDVEAIPEFAVAESAQALVKAPAFQERLTRCRSAEMVQYAEVAELKKPVLKAVFDAFEQSATPDRQRAFEDFRQQCDPLLTESCVYAAIREHMTGQDLGYRDCGRWPEELKHSASAGVAEFQKSQAALVRYQLWQQWVADEQLQSVRQACEGMAVGLYRDLAVGANPSGAEVWSNPEVMVSMAEVGAPPDILNTAGQNWVLPPFHPQKMKEDGYRSFIALLRTNMRHAGGVRIDHAMALERLYWIPRGGKPKDGGYVHYPIEDLIGVIALESHRNKCLVVGEDLGTVPKGFRERMALARILSYKVLLLEEEEKGGGYVKGTSYQRLALSTASSHDLPTLRGWWEGVDLRLRERLGFTPADRAEKDRAKRESDRSALVGMFRADGLLDGDGEPDTAGFIEAAHKFLLRTQAVLMMAQLEDIVEDPEQVNLPASMPDQYPSWSRRSPVMLEALAADPRMERLSRVAQQERG